MGHRSRPGQKPDVLRKIYGSPFEGFGEAYTTRGVITSVSAGKCFGVTEDGKVFSNLDWPGTEQSPGGGMCIAPPEIGATVLIHTAPTGSHILKMLPTTNVIGGSNTFKVSDTTVANIAQAVSGSAFTGDIPSDALPGDRVWIGNQGQKLGLLEGGVAFLMASPWAGVRALVKDDTLQLLGRNLEIQTGFGRLAFTDHAGKQGLQLLGGTDRLTETGTGRDNWTVRLNIGPTSRGFMDFQLLDTTGDNLYSFMTDRAGNVSTSLAGDESHDIDGQGILSFGQGRNVDIPSGDDICGLGTGNRLVTIGGNDTSRTSKNASHTVGSDRTDMVLREWTLSAGRNMRLTTSGDLKLGKPGDAAVKWNVSNGSFVLDIGNPLNMDLVKTLSGLDVTTWGLGNIQFHQVGLGKIILDTALPMDSVLLGSIKGVAPFHAPLFETLQAFLSALITYLDTHTHPTGVGPSGVPIVPSAATLSSMIAPIMSQKVCIGL